MIIRNVSPRGALDVPSLHRIVEAGERIDIPDDIAAPLLEQPDNWQPVQPTKEKS